MWQRLKNLFFSLRTYTDLSPDLRMRRRVNRSLGDRARLSASEWFQTFWQPLGICPVLSQFIYSRFQDYTGLTWGRVQPSDRLFSDLGIPLVCWFDWENTLMQDMQATFGVNLKESFDPTAFETVYELVVFLNQQVLTQHQPKLPQ
jgi:hypothetical protein